MDMRILVSGWHSLILSVTAAISCLAMGGVPPGKILVFPGAQGFGTDTPAGRGGVIYRVTSLGDHGSGSLRKALASSGAKIIVFEVGGVISLASDLIVKYPFITIAGQTAPSPGITLVGAGLRIVTHDVLVQHLRIRPGDAPAGTSPVNRDALQILSPKAYNVVVDHVSASWAIDENISFWGGPRDVTLSHCLISSALNDSLHPKGPHSNGLLIGEGSQRVALVQNVLANNASRNPRLKGGVSAAVVNNVFYNSQTSRNFGSIGSDSGPNILSAVGNKFIAGPNTGPGAFGWKVESNASIGSKVYFEDNQAPGGSHLETSVEVFTAPIWHKSLIAHPASQIEDMVLRSAGARPADRDAVDARTIREVRNRTGAIIDSPSEVGGLTPVANIHRTFSAPSNPHGDDDGDGYTNIEEVLHRMAAGLERERMDRGQN